MTTCSRFWRSWSDPGRADDDLRAYCRPAGQLLRQIVGPAGRQDHGSIWRGRALPRGVRAVQQPSGPEGAEHGRRYVSSGAWQTRTLDSTTANDQFLALLALNEITLPAAPGDEVRVGAAGSPDPYLVDSQTHSE
jgi:hypothetical protein